LQLDSGEDEKMTLWRVLVMDHKKEDFINSAKKDIRCYVKEYDEDEIINLPKEMKERDQIKNTIEEKKKQLFNISDSGYSEVYQALLHLKFLRLYVESTLKYGNSEHYQCIIFTQHGKEATVVSKMIKVFSDSSIFYNLILDDAGWYGTKEEIKDTEDFYPFILIKLAVPSYL
jgi:V-type H+-transporting ATPase subunit C